LALMPTSSRKSEIRNPKSEIRNKSEIQSSKRKRRGLGH
jgi:hypothetical protein